MASALIPCRTSCVGLPSKLPLPSTFHVKVHVSAFSSPNIIHFLKHKDHGNLPRPRASYSEELPTEIVEDSKFVPLNEEDLQYGPPALLLVGFEVGEAVQIQQLLKELDGEFLEVIFCTEDMITGSLWEAVNTKQPNLDAQKVAKSMPRICFLSGLSGEEMMMFMDAFDEIGLQPPIFAALVPNSADKPLQELIEEIMADDELLSATKSA